MKRAIPFLLLGAIGSAGYFGYQGLKGQDPVDVPDDTSGSVRLTASLEHGKLLANQGNETYAQVVLEGLEGPDNKDIPPLSLVLLIDTSGSMHGDKIENAKASALAAIHKLREGDRVSVITFSSGSQVLASNVLIGEGSLSVTENAINQLRASGGTDMVAGLTTARIEVAKMLGDGRNQRVLLLSDGRPDTENGLTDLVAGMSQRGVSTTALGLGQNYNEDLMARLADKGLGNYYFIETPDQMTTVFASELNSIASVVGRRAVLALEPLAGVEILEVYGYESAQNGKLTHVPVGDIYAKRRADVLVRLRVTGDKGTRELVNVSVDYEDALASKQARASQKLAATFTQDQVAVTASLDYRVSERIERVRTAKDIEEATTAIASGNRAKATQIFKEQQQRLGSLNQMAKTAPRKAGGKAASKRLEKIQVEMKNMMDQAAEAPAAVYTKRAKAKARAYKK